jgi:hypothetical protein
MDQKDWTLLAAMATLTLTLGHAAAEQPDKSHPFNGDWKVALTTETGMCGSALQYGIAIENGTINPRAGSRDSSINVFGRVDSGGHVRVTLVKGTARAAAIGQLKLGSGSGTWQLRTLGCAGRWSAARL